MRTKIGRWLRASWPWMVLVLTTIPAIWHTVDVPEDIDSEFPQVVRPTFSRRPPPAYRLAEPGDTIDHIALYVATSGVVLVGMGWTAARRARSEAAYWPSALGISLGLAWYAAIPGPSFDGWHGLGWRVILDSQAPSSLRWTLALAALALLGLVLWPILALRGAIGTRLKDLRRPGVPSLLGLAAVLIVCRQFEIPGVEPVGYWSRWALVLGLLAWNLALVRLRPPIGWRPWGVALRGVCALAWWGLVMGGLWLFWYHRPLERFKTIEPGRLYISAMPTPEGLEVAQRRHHFKTIINLFAEDIDEHPLYPAERRFAQEHGITYLLSPSNPKGADAFLDQTLAVAQDPEAWPVLVHCHGCMDRTPAWLGIYRFVVQGRPLDEIMKEIERHRGYRPKATVTLLYNWNLPRLAPERHAQDPTAQLLMECNGGRRLPPSEFMRYIQVARRP